MSLYNIGGFLKIRPPSGSILQAGTLRIQDGAECSKNVVLEKIEVIVTRTNVIWVFVPSALDHFTFVNSDCIQNLSLLVYAEVRKKWAAGGWFHG